MVAILKKGATKEAIRKVLAEVENNFTPKGVDAQKYCGTIQLKRDPLIIQKELRNEWE